MPEAIRIKIPDDVAERYAIISGDQNPLHLDDHFAKRAGFNGAIVHGMLTLALCYESIFSQLKDQRKLEHLSVRFREPLYPGATLCIHSNPQGNALSVTTNMNQSLFKDFDLVWGAADRNAQHPFTTPTLLEAFTPVKIVLTTRMVEAYQSFMTTLLPNYRRDSPPLFLLAQNLIVQLLKHLDPTHPLRDHRVLHLAQDLTIRGTLTVNQEIILTGGVTQKSHKMGQDFLHFYQNFSAQDGKFQMQAKGFGVVQRLA